MFDDLFDGKKKESHILRDTRLKKKQKNGKTKRTYFHISRAL